MSTQTIARRYSTALADVLLKQGDTDIVKNELGELGKLFSENTSSDQVFGNPAITHANKKSILDALIVRSRRRKRHRISSRCAPEWPFKRH